MHQQPRFVRDGTGRHKIKVSLPGGRYQLSLDDRAVNVLKNDLNFELRDTLPDVFVPFFVALGDAWFPSEKDIDSVIQDLQSRGTVTKNEKEALIAYVSEANIPARHEDRVRLVLDESIVADAIEPEELNIVELPEIPEGVGLAETSEESALEQQINSTSAPPEKPPTTSEEESTQTPPGAARRLQAVPGVGPERADSLVEGGITSVEGLVNTRPIELASIHGISEGMGAVIVEGAREVTGQERPAYERLAAKTGVPAHRFEPVLNSLAATGTTAAEAADTLRIMYGPTVDDIEEITGAQAYYLWEAGYRTLHDLVEASTDELTGLCEIDETAANEISDTAYKMVESNSD